jgi:hypothetical protein
MGQGRVLHPKPILTPCLASWHTGGFVVGTMLVDVLVGLRASATTDRVSQPGHWLISEHLPRISKHSLTNQSVLTLELVAPSESMRARSLIPIIDPWGLNLLELGVLGPHMDDPCVNA